LNFMLMISESVAGHCQALRPRCAGRQRLSLCFLFGIVSMACRRHRGKLALTACPSPHGQAKQPSNLRACVGNAVFAPMAGDASVPCRQDSAGGLNNSVDDPGAIADAARIARQPMLKMT
jgi:hypothetical protein